MPSVAVVTDSTAGLPDETVSRLGLTVVPLSVVIGDRVLEEGTEVRPADVAAALVRRDSVTTSRPNPAAFVAAYRAAAAAGAEEIVSVHLSAELSGTYDAALLAAADAPVPVRVVDSRLIARALGNCVLTAAQVAADGGTADQAAEAARDRAKRTAGFFYVDTLEYLRRGGRIGAARALLGSALAVKPLLHLADGRIQPLEKVRTAARAIARLEEIAVAEAGDGPVDLAVHHLAATDRAEALADRLRARVPGLAELVVEEVGAVVGAHVGPGLLAVVISPRPDL